MSARVPFYQNRLSRNSLEDAVNRKMVDPSDAELKAFVRELNAANSPQEVDGVLREADKLLGGHGVEALTPEGAWVNNYYQNAVLLYVNHGDTYTATLLYDTEARKFSVGSWGDWYEAWERKQEREE